MSDNSEVGVDSNVSSEERKEDTNTTIDQQEETNAVVAETEVKVSERCAGEVEQASVDIETGPGKGDNVPISCSTENPTMEGNKDAAGSGSPVVEIRSNTDTEKTEGSDDGSEYKDAVVSKEDRGDTSDTDSRAGSESSAERTRIGRRNRRPSNQLSKGDYTDDESLDKVEKEDEPPGERESGDGEEKTKDKVVDRDEDKKDPQYIPKKGVFYEHDDRTADSGPADTTEEPKDAKKKKFVADKIDRWGHDMYDTTKQSPKTTQDLIDYYGYDIRNEAEPPKAWRSRRYGRGPNKYTRQWQDEAAYRNKRPQPNKPPTPFKNDIEDFPTVEQSKSNYRRNKNRGPGGQKPEQSIRDKPDRGSSHGRPQPPREPRNEPLRKRSDPLQPLSPPAGDKPLYADRPVTSKESKYKDIHVEKTVFLNKKKPFSTTKTKSEAEAEADIAALSREFSNAVINIGRDGKILPIGSNTGNGSNGSNNNHTGVNSSQLEQVETTMEVRVEPQVPHTPQVAVEQRSVKQRREATASVASAASSKSKRYSTQRQRSLPQSNHLQQQQQQQQPPSQQQQQQFLHQQQFYPPPPPPQTAPPDPVPDSTIFSGFQGNAPPPVYPESMQSVVFLPGYPPTPPAHLLNYCPAPQQYGMPPPLGPPPPDMFPAQPPPGITYYSPQSQVQPRPPASRRVKVAIPIVAPPDQQSQPDQPCS